MKYSALSILATISVIHKVHIKYLYGYNYTYKMYNTFYGIICVIILLNNNKHYKAGWGLHLTHVSKAERFG